MIIHPNAEKATIETEIDAFNAANYVKQEVEEAAKFLLKKGGVRPESYKEKNVIKVSNKRYQGWLKLDRQSRSVKELEEVVRNGKRMVTFKDSGSHRISEVRLCDSSRTVYLRLIEEMETGVSSMSGFLIADDKVSQLY